MRNGYQEGWRREGEGEEKWMVVGRGVCRGEEVFLAVEWQERRVGRGVVGVGGEEAGEPGQVGAPTSLSLAGGFFWRELETED